LLKTQALRKKIELKNECEADLAVRADTQMIRTVIRNLISNAIKFTNVEGHVTISTSIMEDQVAIHIKDDGIGMDEDTQQKVFGRALYSTIGTDKEKGTGLGLKLCKEFVEKNEGQLSVSSQPGSGTTFTITMPAN
jgi:signal transduction histidine kinase